MSDPPEVGDKMHEYEFVCRSCKLTFFTSSNLRPSYMITHGLADHHQCPEGEFGIGDMIRYRQVADGEVGA